MPQEKTRHADSQVRAMRRRLHRERLARLDAEEIAESTIRVLYDKQRELRLYEAIIAVSNESCSVEEMLKGAVEAVCTHTKWPVGHAFVRDPVLGYLVPTGIWHVSPPGAYEEFRRATESATFDEGVGLPGLVLETGEARWIADADTDPVVVRRGMGLRSAFAFPIMVEGSVEGVVEVFSPGSAEPDRSLLDVVAEIGIQLGRVVQRIRAQEKTEHQALHDALTGLANRTLFRDRMDHALREARRNGEALSVLVIDLDRFKEVNDTFGHAIGDELLREIARCLGSLVRDSDTVARMGGDEFAMLLPGTDTCGADQVARKLQDKLDEPFCLSRLSINVQATIGIASAPQHGTDGDTLLQRADTAMYSAKGGSVGHAVYSADRAGDDRTRFLLAGDLRRAIRDRELVLHYQPKLDLQTSRVAGVEALVRWRHAQRGLVAPDMFVPLAEQIGMIRPLTLRVLDVALRQCGLWQAQGTALTVAVNVSAQSLLDPELVGDIAGLLDAHGVPPHLLELELTETSVMRDPVRSVTVLGHLREMGVRLSIDDYGTGYSSLAYLTRLPVHEIKIDRAFVTQMDSSRVDALVVRSTVDLGHNLGLAVVAEGVETDASLRELTELGCDAAQGYLISRPLPAEDLGEWLDARPRTSPSVPPSE